MPPGQGGLGQGGQKAQHRQAGGPGEGRGQQAVEGGGASVEKKRPDAALGGKLRHPFGHGAEAEGRAPGGEHQHRRRPGELSRLPGRGLGGGAAHPVVIAHGPLKHQKIALPGGPGNQGPGPGGGTEEEVQVIPRHPQRPPVKGGVQVVGADFEGRRPQPLAPGQGQKGAGEGGFAPAAGRGGEEQLPHGRTPTSRNTGFWASISR